MVILEEHKMLHNIHVSPIEKIISVLSYLTMGIIGLLWFLIAYFMKKRLRYFLMYNIVQSMIISVFLAILSLAVNILLSVLTKIPFIDVIVVKFSLLMQVKIIRLFNLAFSFPELILYAVILYIIAGILLGRIFYIPYLTNLMTKTMKNYS